jgi:hypothetical protein
MRERLPVDSASMSEWLARPEWAYLVAFLHEAHDDAMASLVAGSPPDIAAVARAQAEVRFLRFFTSGEIAEAMKSELKEKRA